MNRFKFRISTLMFLVLVAAMAIALFVQTRRYEALLQLHAQRVRAEKLREAQVQSFAARIQQAVSAINAKQRK